MRLYPPLFFNRIWTQSISQDFKTVRVKVIKSILNKNLQGGIFGGTLFSGADPYPAVQLWNILRKKGYQCEAWLKNSEIDYVKPARSSVYYEFYLTNAQIKKAEEDLRSTGRAEIHHQESGKDKNGIVVTNIRSLTVIKLVS